MSQSRDRNDTESGPPRAPGRFAAAWKVLRGEALVPDQIRAEWAEYQLIFGDLLQRWSAMQARAAKLERQRLERMAQDRGDQVPTRPVPVPGDKAALRSLAAQKLGLGPYARAATAKHAPMQLDLPTESDA